MESREKQMDIEQLKIYLIKRIEEVNYLLEDETDAMETSYRKGGLSAMQAIYYNITGEWIGGNKPNSL